MSQLRRIYQHGQAVAGSTRFDESFGIERVMRICQCGYAEAYQTILMGVRQGFFLRQPTARLSVRLNPAKVDQQ